MVYSTLDIFTTVVSTRGRVTHRVKLVVGATHTPSWYFSSCSNPVEQGTPEEGSCKTPPPQRKLKKVWLVAVTTGGLMSLCSMWNNSMKYGHVPKNIIVKISRVEYNIYNI